MKFAPKADRQAIRLRILQLLLSTMLGITCSPLLGYAADTASTEWRSHGGDPGGVRFSPLKKIHAGNVGRLARAWTYHTGELDPSVQKGKNVLAFQCTPLVVDNRLYLITPLNRVIALDAETGKELWVFDPKLQMEKVRNYPRHRGVAYWEGQAGQGAARKRIIYGTGDGRLIALNADTGKPCADFGRNGEFDLRVGVAERFPGVHYGVTAPPAIYENLVIVGSVVPEQVWRGPSGDVRAFDARTGKLVWQFHTVPRPGEYGHETWAGDSWKDRSGVNVWAAMSVDMKTGLVFLPISAPAFDLYGGDRKGANLFGNSLVALDARTGRRVWHYQTVHHDIWDRDIPAQPNLITVRRDGRPVPAVAVITKMGFVFVLDRRTGQPLFPVEERIVPQSDVPGEASWPTQPVPILPRPLSRTSMTRDEITDVTPESRKFCTELYNQLEITKGMFTPFARNRILLFPGTLGGATWSGASFDPASGLLYVNVNNLGTFGAATSRGMEGELGQWPKRFWDDNELPCQRPPWGTLNAVDLNSGDVRWSVPLGIVEELAAKGLTQTGTPNLGGSIVTAGGLVFIGGSTDRRFRAFDAASGKILWETKMEGSGHATPITYQGRKTKRQFVVIAAGGGGYLSRHSADALAAFALPEASQAKER